jgi:transcriptional regulator with GAF, ATPase, and Fis domain
MNIDEKIFFREATLRILGSLEIEKALLHCLRYISAFIPAGQMSFHVYNRSQGIVETVANATHDGSRALSIHSQLSAEGRRQAEQQRSIRVRLIERLGDDPVTAPVARELGALDQPALVMDLVLEHTFLGIVSVFGDGRERFSREHMRLMRILNKPFAVALTNSLRYRELSALRDLLADDNRYLHDELRRIAGENVVGADFGLRGVMEQVRQVAPLDSPVLLLGETGSGKEVIANAIHNASPRRPGPFIKVNCGAIPQTLMDSELFGHEKGAFTGALSQKRGLIERARGGTLFLDEVGELPPEAQVRLLRVLQEKEIVRVGGHRTLSVDIRIIAATHRNLENMLMKGDFREDLYFRLRVFPIAIPPLRRRPADIPALAQHFIQKKVREMKRHQTPTIAPEAMNRLMRYPWPGNVRELENAVERALILNQGPVLNTIEIGASIPTALPSSEEPPAPGDENLAIDVVMARHIRRVLAMCQGRVEGPRGAAVRLQIHPSTLRKRMQKLGIAYGRRRIKLDRHQPSN